MVRPCPLCQERHERSQRGLADLRDVLGHPHCRDMQGQEATYIYRRAEYYGVTRCGVLNRMPRDPALQVSLRIHGDPFWIGRAGTAGRVTTSGHRGNLRRCKGHDLSLRVVTIATQDMVQIAPGSSHDQHTASLCEIRHAARRLQQTPIDAGGYTHGGRSCDALYETATGASWRAINTGHGARRTTFSATLPRRIWERPVRP